MYPNNQQAANAMWAPLTKDEQSYEERQCKEVSLAKAVSEQKAYTGFAGIFMIDSWICTYIAIASLSWPMFCMAAVCIYMMAWSLHTIRVSEHKVTDLLIDLL